MRPHGASASWPRPPRRRIARREGRLVRLVDGIVHRRWLCGLAHRTTERLVVLGRDGGRTGCAVGVHESYDGTPRRMASGSCSDRLVGGARASHPAGSVRRRPVSRGTGPALRRRAGALRQSMTGRPAARTRPVDTEPKSWPRSGPRPRVPATATHARHSRAARASSWTGSPSSTCRGRRPRPSRAARALHAPLEPTSSPSTPPWSIAR
jgi:hypothetical protein